MCGLDCYNYVKENNIKNKSKVEAMKSKFNLKDPWRIYNPNDKMYTWQRRNPIKQAWLDFFLISEELIFIVSQVKILTGYRTDHSLLFLELKIDDFKKGRGSSRFNNSPLKDYDYVLQIKSIISETKNEY